MHAVAILTVALILTACASSEAPEAAPAPVTLLAGASCPITAPDVMLPALAPVAGTFPLWVTSQGHEQWSDMSSTQLAPEPYRTGKRVWVVDTRAPGKLRITGRQLDGTGIVLFAQREPEDKEASPVLEIQSAEEGPMGSPPGFQLHGFLIYYPGPGCYQLTGTLADQTVQIVVEIVDRP